ncbi:MULTISPECIES: M81 family metallopeptidase [unclassified Sinorhizobium]|uniref:M81 family metallopeptidase n=1 Tax=unclassified Sinorhizobium TaxID=2613772 RepID=UPI0024C335D9|nr:MULTISPECIES: M81 family metallopeptidase [unclassified Sinorhizobium]MDK1378289.1 M81 family metallopeptidase [Sinorhizobium sp. 6-70]MDK1482268.1 M81 family metallopeptidase [Sinorhizobium sp. 6-117]
MKKRIAVGRLFHESHGYARPTMPESIAVVRGDKLIEDARGNGTTLGGIVDALTARHDVELLPISDSMIAPSGPIDHGFYVEQRCFWEDQLRRLEPDAVIIDLHGSMGTTEFEDAEGDFLAHIRAIAGENVVIGVGLDLHANITPAMLTAADICIACKQNPHDDYYDTGKRVVGLVFEVLAGRLHPVYTLAKARMITPGKLETHLGPLKEMHGRARAFERSSSTIVDISIYNAYRFGDYTDMGQAAVLLSNGLYPQAEEIVLQFAREFWERREEFRDELLTIGEALDAVAEKTDRLPRALADLGDRTLAGAPGDSTLILQAAINYARPLKGAMTVHDPETVAQAHSVGVGATVAMRLGGKMTPQYQPFDVEGVVRLINRADVKLFGPNFAGESAGIGDTALVEIDSRFQVIVTSKAGFIVDPNVFEFHGVPVSEQDFVVMKSQFHFNRNFNGLATSLYIATPGLAYYLPGVFAKRRARVWPDTDVRDDPIIAPQVLHR